MLALVRLALSVLACSVILSTLPIAAAARTPSELLEAWQSAVDAGDHPSYLDCLYGETRAVPEYGSREAMEFWAQQLEQLRKRGFTGGFLLEPPSSPGPRFPPGSLLAHPIVAGEPIRDAILLIQEAGDWKILRLFS